MTNCNKIDFYCNICKEYYCLECKNYKIVNNKMNCLDCYSNLEYTLYTAVMNEDIHLIHQLIRDENFSDDCLNTTFINSILTFNIKIIDFLINFTSDIEIYIIIALRTFLFHNCDEGVNVKQYQTAKYLIDCTNRKHDLIYILEQLNEKNINLDIIEYLELKINTYF
jgi:hypothetical protein